MCHWSVRCGATAVVELRLPGTRHHAGVSLKRVVSARTPSHALALTLCLELALPGHGCLPGTNTGQCRLSTVATNSTTKHITSCER